MKVCTLMAQSTISSGRAEVRVTSYILRHSVWFLDQLLIRV